MAYDYISSTDYSVPNYRDVFVNRVRGGENAGGVERDIRTKLPYDLLSQYSELAKGGVYGPRGPQRMAAEAFRSGAYRRNLLSRAVRRRMQSRLGSRSLAADTAVLNRVVAPELASAQGRQLDFMRENELSKIQGLEGISNLMNFLQQRYFGQQQIDLQREGSEGGFLDWALPIIELGSTFFGNPAGPAMAAKDMPRRRAQ